MAKEGYDSVNLPKGIPGRKSIIRTYGARLVRVQDTSGDDWHEGKLLFLKSQNLTLKAFSSGNGRVDQIGTARVNDSFFDGMTVRAIEYDNK